MADVTAKDVLIGILTFLVAIAACFALITETLNLSTNAELEKYNDSFNKYNSISGNINEIKDVASDSNPGKAGIFGIVNDFVTNTIGIFSQMWTIFDVFAKIIGEMANGALGISIPTWFTTYVILALIITLAFALVAAWFKWNI